MQKARWLVFDSKVYIAAIQAGVFSSAYRTLEEKLARTYWNDLLIALCARHVGATVVTRDAQDFALLRRYVRFDLHILS